jgi:hypothetical protein
MRNKMLRTISIVVVIFGLSGLCFAATTIRIAANIPATHQMDVVLHKANPAGLTEITDLAGVGMNFGDLILGGDNNYTSENYFYIDAPVSSNQASWSITHTRSNFASVSNSAVTLNDNVNVKFMKVDNSTSNETLLGLTGGGYVSYNLSQNKVIPSSLLTGNNRLRIYYSITNGTGDAASTSRITTAKATGAYTGTVTLTLSGT